MTALAWVSVVALAILVASLLRLSAERLPARAWDQWHHGFLLFAALPLPVWVRWTCCVIGADDALNHLMEVAFGWKEKSPLAVLYRLVCERLGMSG